MIRRNLIALAALTFALVLPAAAQADFGIAPGSVSMQALKENGTLDTQASSHPYSFTIHFDLKTDAKGNSEGGVLRNAIVELPPGLIGNPNAVPRCSHQDFEGLLPVCPLSTQVGVLRVILPEFGVQQATLPIYNLVPPPGVASEFGVSANEFISLQFGSVRSEEGYGLRVAAINSPLEVTSVTETIWGVPADSGHDTERGESGQPIHSDAPRNAYLTLPATCGSAPEVTVKVDSRQEPGVYSEETATPIDGAGKPAAMIGCDGVPFAPKISSQPTTKLAQNPSGLDFELKLPNQGLTGPGLNAETEPKKTVVTLPEGMSVNPSFAEGVGVCSKEQYAAEKIDSKAGAGCPEASKLGSVIAHSPLLEEPLEGAVYLAAPYENPFGTLAAMYLVARAPERGVLVKQAGRIDFDQATGQITTTFDDLPPVPYSSFKLHFREGARAPLATPQACGEYKTTASFTPFSANDDSEAIQTTGSFQIDRGADGGPCPTGGLPPFKPGLLAGSLNAAAGRFSPFYLDLNRSDTEQEITHFSIKLPPGVTAKLAGVPFCSEAAIAQARSRERIAGAGQAELDSPSCPSTSQIGRTLVGVGVGPALAYVAGKAYLAGPYHGSAISVVAITAAKVGPFDVGTVVVRDALRLDPETGEVFVDATGSDPIPHIVSGIPVHARDIGVHVDKDQFSLNPTNCKQTSTASTLLGSGLDFASEADDRPVTVSTPYQVVNCAKLPFKPRLSLKLKGGTTRGAHPALKATLRMNGIGEAGVRRAEVILPSSEFIENAHFKTICTRVIFKQGTHPGERCPAGSIYGKAVAKTPLLSEPLTGPVFLRSSEHQLPDVVAALHNGEIDVVLVGKVDSVKGRLRNTFEATPDAPVSSVLVSLQGGKKGLFVNSTDLCKETHKVEANFTGQNGKEWNKTPELVAQGCKGKAKKQKRKAG